MIQKRTYQLPSLSTARKSDSFVADQIILFNAANSGDVDPITTAAREENACVQR